MFEKNDELKRTEKKQMGNDWHRELEQSERMLYPGKWTVQIDSFMARRMMSFLDWMLSNAKEGRTSHPHIDPYHTEMWSHILDCLSNADIKE